MTDAGSVEATLRLRIAELEKDLDKANAKITVFTNKMKKEGDKAAENFTSGFKKGFDEIGKDGAKLGANLAKSLNPYILAVGAVTAVIKGMADALINAINKNTEYKQSFENLGNTISSKVNPVIDYYASGLALAADALDGLINGTDKEARSLASIGKAATDAAKGLRTELLVTLDKIKSARRADAMTEEQSVAQSIDARRKYIAVLDLLISKYPEVAAGVQSTINMEENAIELGQERLTRLQTENSLIAQKNKLTGDNAALAAEVAIQTNKSLSDYEKQIALIDLQRKGELARINTQFDIIKSTQTDNKLTKEQLDLQKSLTTQINRQATLKKQGVKDNTKGAPKESAYDAEIKSRKEIEKMEKEETAALALNHKERTRILKERGAGWVELMGQQEDYRNAVAKTNEKYFDRYTQLASAFGVTAEESKILFDNIQRTGKGIARMADDGVEKQSKFEKAWGGAITDFTEHYGTGVVGVMNVTNEAMAGSLEIFNAIAEGQLEKLRQNVEETKALIEQTRQDTIEQAEKDRQADLEAAGFAKAQTKESLDAQIERAKEAGDQILQYQLERRMEELQINKNYDDKITEAEDIAKRATAEQDYKLAHEQWRLNVNNSILNGIMAFSNALAAGVFPWSLIPAGLAATAAGIQTGYYEPEAPKYATGGIVPGNSYSGDNMLGRLNSGEGIFTPDQMKAMGMIANGSAEAETESAVIQLTVVMQLDGREMARVLADVYGSGMVTIPLRGVASR
jgi:hypothetical protein